MRHFLSIIIFSISKQLFKKFIFLIPELIKINILCINLGPLLIYYFCHTQKFYLLSFSTWYRLCVTGQIIRGFNMYNQIRLPSKALSREGKSSEKRRPWSSGHFISLVFIWTHLWQRIGLIPSATLFVLLSRY